MIEPSLSILIPSIESRSDLLSNLTCEIIQQCGIIKRIKSFSQEGCTCLVIGFDLVEIIIAIDNKVISTGKKRNLLLSLANGSHSCTIDEDDYIYPYYVEEALKSIQNSPDCVSTNGIITTNGINPIKWRLSKDFKNETIYENGEQVYLRTTNHISIFKTELGRKAGFPDQSNKEDAVFSERLNPLLKTESKIEKPMYWYRYETDNKSYN